MVGHARVEAEFTRIQFINELESNLLLNTISHIHFQSCKSLSASLPARWNGPFRGKLLLAEAGIHANPFDLRFVEPDYPAGRQLALNYPVHLVHAFEQVIEQFIFHQSTSLRLISGFSFALASTLPADSSDRYTKGLFIVLILDRKLAKRVVCMI